MKNMKRNPGALENLAKIQAERQHVQVRCCCFVLVLLCHKARVIESVPSVLILHFATVVVRRAGSGQALLSAASARGSWL